MIGGIFLLLWKKASDGDNPHGALVISLIDFILSIPLFVFFNSSTSGPQFVEKLSWIPSIGAEYFIGIDGLSVLLVLLTTFLTPLCVLISWNDIKKKTKLVFRVAPDFRNRDFGSFL